MEFYDLRIGEFLAWLRREATGIERREEIDVNDLRGFRAYMAVWPRPDGKQLQPETLHASHRALHTFFA
jgi:hypothetical protein